jgi:osmotically-inducible protein OsmY
MSKRLYRSALAIAACAVLVAGCDRGDTRADPQTPLTTGEARTDEQLATYIQARYQTDPSIASSDIDVRARDGVVTLEGTVANESAREHAAFLAQQMEGVRSVDNQLRVQAPGQTADAGAPMRTPEAPAAAAPASQQGDERAPGWITTKIQAQYFVDTEVKPWNIDVTTRRDGTVTLQGDVDDTASRDAAERIARATEGVTNVENHLRVRGEREQTGDTAARTGSRMPRADDDAAEADSDGIDHPDGWLTAKVQAKYFMDSEVKGRRINVDTNDGVVTLSGQVETAAERRQAVALAHNTEGVREVIDQLEVRPADAQRTSDDRDARDARGRDADDRRTTGRAIEDGWITTIVQSKFFLDRDIKGRDINVDTRAGVVTLSGEVDSQAEREAAQAIVEETEGVNRVVNRLVVTTARNQ